MLICLLFAFSCNKTLNKPNNNNFGINCYLIFRKSVMSPIRMVVQQSALSSPNEYVCVCVCVCVYVCVCVLACLCVYGIHSRLVYRIGPLKRTLWVSSSALVCVYRWRGHSRCLAPLTTGVDIYPRVLPSACCVFLAGPLPLQGALNH